MEKTFNFTIKKIHLYIASLFLKNFLLVIACVASIIFVINLFDIISRVEPNQFSWWQVAFFPALQIPSFIESISDFLIALAAIITLFVLSLRSEITIIRASGMSFWRILFPMAVTAFLLGVFFVGVFNPISIIANQKFNSIEQQFIANEENTNINLLAPRNGIWLKQSNALNENEEIIIRAQKIYRKTLKMYNVNLWFFDEKNNFYKKIDAKTMFLEKDSWKLSDVVINDRENINQKEDNLEVATNLKSEFITKKIINNFESVTLFSIYDLPDLIVDLRQSGFSPQKFIVYFHSLLNKPFLFVAMVLIAAFFAINNVRNRNNILFFIAGIMLALILHIGLMIISAIGSSGLIPEFLSTWLVSLILLSFGMLLIFRKEAIT
jgi:lipopolysaccharide export system permease protein